MGKTGKLIVIESNDNIKFVDFTGYETIKENLHSEYQDVIHIMRFNDGYINFMSANEFHKRNKSKEEFKKVNVFGTSIYKPSALIYGNILAIYVYEDGDIRGFTDDECNQILTEIRAITDNPKYKDMQEQMHKLFDR